jgi:hypothetical protein
MPAQSDLRGPPPSGRGSSAGFRSHVHNVGRPARLVKFVALVAFVALGPVAERRRRTFGDQTSGSPSMPCPRCGRPMDRAVRCTTLRYKGRQATFQQPGLHSGATSPRPRWRSRRSSPTSTASCCFGGPPRRRRLRRPSGRLGAGGAGVLAFDFTSASCRGFQQKIKDYLVMSALRRVWAARLQDSPFACDRGSPSLTWFSRRLPGDPRSARSPRAEPRRSAARTLADAEREILGAAADYSRSLRHRSLPEEVPRDGCGTHSSHAVGSSVPRPSNAAWCPSGRR